MPAPTSGPDALRQSAEGAASLMEPPVFQKTEAKLGLNPGVVWTIISGRSALTSS